MLHAISQGTGGLPVVFPVHPRTAKNLRELEGQIPGLNYVDPQGYLEFNYLVKHAKAVITDSGGITEETTVMGVPCMTLRDNTERPERIVAVLERLLPSYREGLPKSLIEAAACALPLVTTDAPGCREVVTHEVDGLLVPVRDASALAQAIERLHQDPTLARQLGQAARACAQGV